MENYQTPQSPAPTNGKAVASLVCGIVALIVAWFGWGAIVSIALSIVGIVLGVNAKKEMPQNSAGLATGGIVCSIIALVLSTVVFIACVLCVGALGTVGSIAGGIY